MSKVRLIDASNLLGEAVDLIEASFMASIEVPDERMRNALRAVIDKAGDIARQSLDLLNDEIASNREGTDG